MISMVDDLLQKYSRISSQVSKKELSIILNALSIIIENRVEGDVVEFGCFSGTTSLFMSRLLQLTEPARTLHAYDSFEGLPPKNPEDASPAGQQFQTGSLRISKKEFVMNFKRAQLPLPSIHKGWFENLESDDIPDKIAFAFLDGDYYSSIKTSLKLIKPRLSKGAVIIVDDYQNEALPGAQKAVDEWLGDHHFKLQSNHTLAIIQT